MSTSRWRTTSGGFCEKAGVAGATVSTMTDAEPAVRETFPAASTDRTSSVWVPCARSA